MADTDFRTATLAGFNGLGADGEWTIFFADVEAMGQSTVVGWGLDIAAPVPEPVGWALGGSLGLLGWAVGRRAPRPVPRSRRNDTTRNLAGSGNDGSE